MIYLSTEIISGLGEDTFWTWFKREFPNSSFNTPKKLEDDDVLLRYSTLGFLPIQGKQISICWELYFDMRDVFSSREYEEKIRLINDSAKYSTYRAVATEHSLNHYNKYGRTYVLPIGVDTNLFRPLRNKEILKANYGLPNEGKIGFWIGTTHPMKGFSSLLEFKRQNPDVYWVIVWKDKLQGGYLEGAKNFYKISQSEINDLINCSDFSLFTSRFKPLFIAEWEILSTNIPIIQYPNIEREIFIDNNNNRKAVFDRGWSRDQVKNEWSKLFNELGITI